MLKNTEKKTFLRNSKSEIGNQKFGIIHRRTMILPLLIYCLTAFTVPQSNCLTATLNSQSHCLTDTTQITFRDTISNIVVDSLTHNLGQIVPTNNYNRLVKYFKYIGTEPVYVVRVWTSDPHYICQYPTEILIPNKVYSFTTCFAHHGRQGKMKKIMGLDLSDGTTISLKFTGTYIPK
jgi:hypothetical protein